MKKIAKFEKVSFEQFKKDWKSSISFMSPDEKIREAYDLIATPKRSTYDSAGYDFVSPIQTILYPGKQITIPTGIRVRMEPGWVLKCYPRSGYGFKTGVRLANGTGIIDGDYYYSGNEGHIMVKLLNDSCIEKELVLETGKAFIQGVFVEYGITIDDDEQDKNVRDGGFGSTDASK